MFESTLKNSNLINNDVTFKKKIIMDNLITSLTCPICMELIDKPIEVKCCNQIFCQQCLYHCIGNKKLCPMCRTSITNYESYIINTTSSVFLHKLIKEVKELQNT